MVERQPSKLNVAGSNPVSRSTKLLNEINDIRKLLLAYGFCCLKQSGSLAIHVCRRSSGVERFLGKEEVTSSILVVGSKLNFQLSLNSVGVVKFLCVYKLNTNI